MALFLDTSMDAMGPAQTVSRMQQHGLPERLTMDIGTSEDCSTAFHNPDDTQVQVACQEDNVGHLSVVDFVCSSDRC